MGEAQVIAHWIFENPEKGALFIVLMAGGWRIFREIWKDLGGVRTREETLIETLMKENHDLRMENHRLHEERQARRPRMSDGEPPT